MTKMVSTLVPNFASAILDRELNSSLPCFLNDVFSSETETKASAVTAGF
jgi:hypothetical protein